MKMRNFCLLFLIFIMCFSLAGCKDSKENLEIQKGLSEISFLENQCVTIFTKYLSGDYQVEAGIDWDLLSEDYSILSNSIDVIMIDFASIQIPSKSIVEFENSFSDMDSFVKSKNVVGLMGKICDTYSLVSNSILGSVSNDENLKQEKLVKSDLLYLGYFISTESREEAKVVLEKFQEDYSVLSKNRNYLENNSYKLNRVFVDIQKIENFLEDSDFENSIEVVLKMFELI